MKERGRAYAEVSQYSYGVEDHLNIQSATFIMIANIPTMQHMYRKHKAAHYNNVYITLSYTRHNLHIIRASHGVHESTLKLSSQR